MIGGQRFRRLFAAFGEYSAGRTMLVGLAFVLFQNDPKKKKKKKENPCKQRSREQAYRGDRRGKVIKDKNSSSVYLFFSSTFYPS